MHLAPGARAAAYSGRAGRAPAYEIRTCDSTSANVPPTASGDPVRPKQGDSDERATLVRVRCARPGHGRRRARTARFGGGCLDEHLGRDCTLGRNDGRGGLHGSGLHGRALAVLRPGCPDAVPCRGSRRRLHLARLPRLAPTRHAFRHCASRVQRPHRFERTPRCGASQARGP